MLQSLSSEGRHFPFTACGRHLVHLSIHNGALLRLRGASRLHKAVLIVLQMSPNEITEVLRQILQVSVQALVRMPLQISVQLLNRTFEQVRAPQLINNLLDFLVVILRRLYLLRFLILSRLLSTTERRCRVIQVLGGLLQNQRDPPGNVVVCLDMLLNKFVGFPNGLAFDLNKLIDDSFGDPDSHLVVLRLLVMVDH